MPKTHRVKPGESLAKIAHQYGFPNWEPIWEQNTELRELRKSPHVLHPGDEVQIPDLKKRVESRQTRATHQFKKSGPKLELRLVLKDGEGEPFSDLRYELDIEGRIFEGKTDADGAIMHAVDARARRGTLKVNLDEESDDPPGRAARCFQWPLLIGHLDPVEKVSGVQARLNNLGFDSGAVDGLFGPVTRGALEAFQKSCGLEPDGRLTAAVAQRLEQEHGS